MIAQAGSLSVFDAQVAMERVDGPTVIRILPVLPEQQETEVEKVIRSIVPASNINVTVITNGAPDWVIKARITATLARLNG